MKYVISIVIVLVQGSHALDCRILRDTSAKVCLLSIVVKPT